MKHQYFGDENDFHKYLLLRLLRRHGLTVSVIWMLTPYDGSSDGGKLGYLDRGFWRRRDPELFEWLSRWKGDGAAKDVGLIERSRLLDAKFFREIVPASPGARQGWLDDALRAPRC
jgi:hypothetical protein